MFRWRYALLLSLSFGGLWGCAAPAAKPLPAVRDTAWAERCNAAGLQLIEQKKLAEAQAQFEQAVSADPFYGPAHCNLGVLYLQLDQPFEAATELQYAAKLMPRASPPRANLGVLFERAGQYGAAEEELKAALELNPDDIEIIGHLARIHVRQGKFNDETQHWLETVALRDEDPQWRQWAGQALSQRQRGAAEGGSP